MGGLLPAFLSASPARSKNLMTVYLQRHKALAVELLVLIILK